MRRKDYGRRRALGASRSFIISLLLTQTALLALVGSIIGAILATAILLIMGDPLPGIPFTAAVTVLAILASALGAVIPAIVASRREPIRELRVA